MTPETINRYQVQGEIGRGGMATVYKAFDPRFDRVVAIKVLPREFLHDPEFRARFEREAKTIATLEHSAIVPVYDYGEQDGQLYLVMRFMPGGSMADRLQQGPLSVEEAAEVIKRIGSALDSAHLQGVIHRDLKPGNILLDQHGDAYLGDFGIAHLTTAQTALTASGRLVGTPTYMSPEQVYGDKVLDGRSDIYALGVILYQMLTGEAPYRADTPAKVMMKHVMDPVPNVLDEKPDLPVACESVIRKAMAKERDERYPTVNEMAAALTAVTKTVTRPDLPFPETLTMAEPDLTIPRDSIKPQPALVTTPPSLGGTALTADLPASIPQLPEQKVSIWIWIGAGVALLAIIVLVVSVLIVAGNTFLAGGGKATETPTLAATSDLEPTTSVEQPTALAETLATATAVPPTLVEDTSTKAAEAAATRRAEVAATASAAAIPTIDLAATRRAAEAAATANAPSPPATSVGSGNIAPNFGPANGRITHELDDRAESEFALVNLRDFATEVTFGNPFAGSSWDMGITFRQVEANDEFRLVIRGDGLWSLNNRTGDADNFVNEGDVTRLLNLAENGRNKVTLIANGDTGYFLLNDQFISTLDLSSRSAIGDIAISTGYYLDSERAGAATTYEGFTVWALTPSFGPGSGELAHEPNDLVKSASSDQDQLNFIAAATFLNPFNPNRALWDYGYSFRQTAINDQFWLILRGDGSWLLRNRVDGAEDELDTGVVEGMDLQPNGRNHLALIVWNGRGYFFLNDIFVTELNLSARLTSGDVQVVTAFFLDSEIAGEATGYEDFAIWPLP
jgi:serine/threonine-protein kinase